MATVAITCMTCGAVHVHGEDEASNEGYLPGHYTSDTCYLCRPDLDAD